MITGETLEIINADLNANSVPYSNNIENLETILKPLGAFDARLQSMTEINVDYREHLRIYNRIIAYYQVLGYFIGIDISYDWEMTHHLTFWSTNILLFGANAYIPYNLYYHISNGNYLKILEPLALCGLCFTVIFWGNSNLKWFYFIKHYKILFSLFFVAKKLCTDNLTKGTRAATVTAGLERTCTVLKVFTIGVIAVLLFYVAVPIKYYLVDGIFIPLMPIKTPFLDENTLKGWLTASTIQGTLGIYSGIATIIFGSGFLICICTYIFMVDLIALDWKDLNEMWNGKSATSIAYRHAFLNNICEKLDDMRSYMNQMKKMYELKFFIYFIVSYLGEVLCLYQINASNWIPGYSAACMVFIEMMFYCCVGTQLSIMDDKMCHHIQQTDWYLFDLHSQKKLQMMLHQCQQPHHITLMSLGTLNMVTGTQIVKGIYTYYTILTELF